MQNFMFAIVCTLMTTR